MTRLEAAISTHVAHVGLYTRRDTAGKSTTDTRANDCANATIAAGVVSTALSVASSLSGLVTLGGAFLAGALGCYTVGLTLLCTQSNNSSSTPFTSSGTDDTDAYLKKCDEFTRKHDELRKQRDAIPFTIADDVTWAQREVDRQKLWVETYQLHLEESQFKLDHAKLRVAQAQRQELYSGDLHFAQKAQDLYSSHVTTDEKALKKAKAELHEAEDKLTAAKQKAKKDAEPVPVKYVDVPLVKSAPVVEEA